MDERSQGLPASPSSPAEPLPPGSAGDEAPTPADAIPHASVVSPELTRQEGLDEPNPESPRQEGLGFEHGEAGEYKVPAAPTSPPPSAPRDPHPRPVSRVGFGVTLVVVAVASGLASALLVVALDDDEPAAPLPESLGSTGSDGEDDGDLPTEPLARIAAAVLPSVVSIDVGNGQIAGQGSGVVIGSDGTILTNDHVVSSLGDDVEVVVTFADGQRATAEVVGTDPASDLAVIRAGGVDGLTPATLGNSADLSVGDTVLAIGSPLGLDGSVSSGIVSAVNRSIDLGSTRQPTPDDPEAQQPSDDPSAVIDAIQTDAAINLGNSGGPLINADGEVVGINTAIASASGSALTGESGSIGVGFAIPVDDARDIAEELIEDGEATHAYLGVQVGEATGEDGATGVAVVAVEEGSPAAAAGLQRGDVVGAIDDDPVSDPAQLASTIRRHDPGDEVTLTVTSDGDERTVEVTLGELS